MYICICVYFHLPAANSATVPFCIRFVVVFDVVSVVASGCDTFLFSFRPGDRQGALNPGSRGVTLATRPPSGLGPRTPPTSRAGYKFGGCFRSA